MVFRYARHSPDINRLADFYTHVIGLKLISRFEAHNGYNGIFLGPKGSSWHLEFTESDEPPNHSFDEEDNLVFYPESSDEWETILQQIKVHGLSEVVPKNPYWFDHGVMILDPDGYRVVISKQRIKDSDN